MPMCQLPSHTWRGVAYLVALSALSGCEHTFIGHISPAELAATQRALGAVKKGVPVAVRLDGDPIEITRDNDPTLLLDFEEREAKDCRVLAREKSESKLDCSDLGVEVPIADASVSNDRLVVRVSPERTLDMPLSEVMSARYRLKNLAHRIGRKTKGIGASMGANGGFGVSAGVLPWSWLGLDIGLLPVTGVAHVFAGARLRPKAIGMAWPYFGGFVSSFTTGGDKETASEGGYGLKMGVDLDADPDWAVSIEGAIVKRDSHSKQWMGMEGSWLPWAGTALTYYY